MISGEIPTVAVETILAIGFRARWEATAADMSSTAAAPSFRPDAFPAVTVPPSVLKAGLSFARAS
jgi:hypothetical protein